MIKKCTLSEIAEVRNIKRVRDIEDFIASGDDCCEYVLEKGEKPYNVQAAFCNSIRNRQYYKDMIHCVTRVGRVFLVRNENKRVRDNNA